METGSYFGITPLLLIMSSGVFFIIGVWLGYKLRSIEQVVNEAEREMMYE